MYGITDVSPYKIKTCLFQTIFNVEYNMVNLQMTKDTLWSRDHFEMIF